MTAVLMFVSDRSDPWGLVARYMNAVPPGSYLSLSHLTDERKPPLAVERFRAVFDKASERMHFRSHADIARFFDGLELVPPYEGAEPGPHLHRHLGRGGSGARGQRGTALALLRRGQAAVIAKPTAEELGIDPDAQEWQRSGEGAGAIEITFTGGASGVPRASGVPGGRASGVPGRLVFPRASGADEPGRAEDWVLMRVAGDPDRRVLVFDRNEWECFLDGARKGEFDDATDNAAP